MGFRIERQVNGTRETEESFFAKRRCSAEAEALLRRVMRRREKRLRE